MRKIKEKEKEFIARMQKHQGILDKICLVYAGNEMEKDDLRQEIILQLWKSYDSFKEQSKFSTWMYRVALNTAITKTRKPVWMTKWSDQKVEFYEMDKVFEKNEDVKVLYKAIARLNKIEKAIILLWLEERSYEEIAETMGMTIKNISVRIVRIKKRLAEIIQNFQ